MRYLSLSNARRRPVTMESGQILLNLHICWLVQTADLYDTEITNYLFILNWLNNWHIAINCNVAEMDTSRMFFSLKHIQDSFWWPWKP